MLSASDDDDVVAVRAPRLSSSSSVRRSVVVSGDISESDYMDVADALNTVPDTEATDDTHGFDELVLGGSDDNEDDDGEILAF